MKEIKISSFTAIVILIVLFALLLSACGKSTNGIYRISLPVGESRLINHPVKGQFTGQTAEKLMSQLIDVSDDEHHGLEVAVAKRIISGNVGLCVPNDDEDIIELGITAHSVGMPGIRLKDGNVISEDLIIQTTCRFTSNGREYLAIMRTDDSLSDELDDLLVGEAAVFGYDISFYGQYNGYMRKADKNRIYCCKVVYNDEPIYITPVEGTFYDVDGSDLIADSFFDFLNLFDFSVVRLKDYLK